MEYKNHSNYQTVDRDRKLFCLTEYLFELDYKKHDY